jgi:hypothetical protein
MQVFTPGNNGDASCPGFCGPSGLFEFDTSCRMPRHVHMAPKDSAPKMGYVVEKFIALDVVAVAEVGGEMYVFPPKRWSRSLVEYPKYGSLPRQAWTYRIWTSQMKKLSQTVSLWQFTSMRRQLHSVHLSRRPELLFLQDWMPKCRRWIQV